MLFIGVFAGNMCQAVCVREWSSLVGRFKIIFLICQMYCNPDSSRAIVSRIMLWS